MKKSKLLLVALDLARYSLSRRGNGGHNRKRYYLAAVGVRADGVVVGSTNHSYPDGPVPAGHAEWRLAKKLTPGSVVAVARVRHDGKPAMAKPCASCMTRLRNRGVTKVHYTTDEEEQ